MANNNETTTKFKVDISELKSAMQDARKQVAYANSEFKAVSSSMDDWSKSSDGISAKLKQLNSNLKAQESVLEAYEKTLEQIKEEYGENSKEALEYATKLNNQRAVVNKIKNEMAGYEDALQEVSEAEKIASKTGKSVADVLEDVGDEAEDAGDGFTVLKGAVAEFVGNGLTALVGGIKDAIGSLMGLADETREYRSEMAKLETAFSTAGFSAETASDTYKDFYAVLGDEGQAVEAVSHLAKLAENEEDLAKWTTIATGVYAEFGASLPIEGLTEAANETAKTGQLTGGLADALNWAGVNEEDFQASLDKCSTEQERQALITETLNGLYSESAKKYEETNKSVMDANKVQSDYTDTLAEMGAKIEPVTTTLKEGFNGLLQELLKLVGDVDMEAFTSKIEEGFAVLKDDVLPAVKEGLGWILDNKDTIIAGLAGIASGFVAFKVAGVIMSLVSAFKAWTVATEGMTIAQRLLNLAMSANPIGIVVTLIATIVGALIAFIATNDEARAKISEVWEAIKSAVGKAVDDIGTFFTETLPEFIDNAVEFFSQLPSKIWTWLVNTYNKVKTWGGNMTTKAKETASSFINKVIEFVKQLPEKVWTCLLNVITKVNAWRTDMTNKAKETALSFINSVIEYVKQLPEKVWTWFTKVVDKVTQWKNDLGRKAKEAGKEILDKLIEKVKEIPEKIKSVGSDIVSGLWNGISDKFGWLTDKIKSFAKNVTDKLKNFFGIASPSKVMAKEVGKWLPEGIAVGITKNAKSVLGAMKDLTVDAVGGARAGLGTATTALGGGSVGGGVVNNFTQVINSPKQLSRLDIYRQSKNLLGYAGGGM